MALYVLNNVTIKVPIHTTESYSIKKRILSNAGRVITKQVLCDINLKIENGARVGLFGPNGSGKTSLLRCLTGSYRPLSGTIYRSGFVTSLIDINMGLDAEANGWDNIQLRLISMGVNHRDPELISRIGKFSGLGDALRLPIRTYSSGMNVRLAFSIVTSVKADILLLDEWLSVGDAQFARASSDRMDALARESSIMVLASHDYALLERQCNRILILESGRIADDIKL